MIWIACLLVMMVMSCSLRADPGGPKPAQPKRGQPSVALGRHLPRPAFAKQARTGAASAASDARRSSSSPFLPPQLKGRCVAMCRLLLFFK